jgi:hypothetical protein
MDTLSVKDDESVLKQIKFPLLELMDKQLNIDHAKKALFKPEFGHLLKLYLKAVGDDLPGKMTTCEANFNRAFGVDKINHLRLLVKLKMIMNEKLPKKGLLAKGEMWQQV